MTSEILGGGVAGAIALVMLKGIEAATAYFNSRKNGGKGNGKCADHQNVCVQIATISTRQETVMSDLTEIKSDVKEIFRSLRDK